MADHYSVEVDNLRKYMVPGGVNVEVGCGCRKVSDDVIAVDPIEKGKAANMSLPSVADLVATALTLDKHFKDGSVDYICAGHAVHYEPDLVKVFELWRRLLKPGCVCAVIDLHESQWRQKDWNKQAHCGTMYGWDYYWRTLDETKQAAEKAELEIVRSEIINPNWSYIVVGRKNG